MNDYLTTPEVAKISNRHKQTVWRDVRRGILPAKLIGGIYLISLRDVQIYMLRPKETHRKQPEAATNAS